MAFPTGQGCGWKMASHPTHFGVVPRACLGPGVRPQWQVLGLGCVGFQNEDSGTKCFMGMQPKRPWALYSQKQEGTL